MSNPIKLTELDDSTVIINADCIEIIRVIDGITHFFTRDGYGMYKVKESLEEIEDLMLRDKFAMSALNGYSSNPETDDLSAEEKSSDAYFIADAMLKARKEGA